MLGAEDSLFSFIKIERKEIVIAGATKQEIAIEFQEMLNRLKWTSENPSSSTVGFQKEAVLKGPFIEDLKCVIRSDCGSRAHELRKGSNIRFDHINIEIIKGKKEKVLIGHVIVDKEFNVLSYWWK